jgi:hypothetical protein
MTSTGGDLDAILSRVRKLLALSKSDNPHEAATAAGQAQKLLTLHGLEASAVEQETAETIGHGGVVHSASRLEKWRIRLAAGVAVANQCRVLITSTPALRLKSLDIFGRPSDVQKARYLYEHYAGETDRLCVVHGKGRGLSWRNSFKHGVVDVLCAAMARAIVEVRATASSTALARLDNRGDDVAAWVKDNQAPKRAIDPTPDNTDAFARQRGREAGQTITRSEARASIQGAS